MTSALFSPPRFPARSAGSIAWFWSRYWFWFLLLLPWMLLRQIAISGLHLWSAVRTRGRSWSLLDGRLHIGFVGSWELLITAGMFGERFTWVRWDDALIDPGPARMRATVQSALGTIAAPSSIVCSHWHEEHIGNAAWLAQHFSVPILATGTTLAAVAQPPPVPGGRQLLMGPVQSARDAQLRVIGERLGTLEVIPADGHCAGHIVLFDREQGVLLAGDAFLGELFTSPNVDTDHRAWIETLERLSLLQVRTLVGAHDQILSCDPRLPEIPAVVRRVDPSQLIADKLAFLRWARSVVAEGERQGQSYGIIEATIFPWRHAWSWRTWFHDEGFRLLTCGEFSRTHLVRSLSATPDRVPVRFPQLLRLGRMLAESAPDLLRIHLLAARLEPVLGIAASILGSAAILVLAASDGGVPSLASVATAAGRMVDSRHWLRLAVVLAAWTWWWAVVGGAITRRMALAVISAPREGWLASLRWCLRPGLFIPSALASACLLAVALAPRWPALLIGMPPVWLVAGILYAGLCLPPGDLRTALGALWGTAIRPLPFLRRQAVFLGGFAASTGMVYLGAGIWWALMAAICGGWLRHSTMVLAAPALIYCLGYTTANLKSLQIWLFLQRDRP